MSVDPIYTAAQVVTALQSIVAREMKPGEPLVVSISAISGGNASNVVVERVALQGTVRWFSQPSREHALERIHGSPGVCSALRATCEFRVLSSSPVTANAAAPVDLVTAAARATERAEVMDPGPLTVSEDFSEFTSRVPGCLFTVGAGGPSAAPHHHHAFDLDERAIGLIAEIFTCATPAALCRSDPGRRAPELRASAILAGRFRGANRRDPSHPRGRFWEGVTTDRSP